MPSQAASAEVCAGSISLSTPAALEGGDTSRRPVRAIRNILERLPTDSDNGRRIALGAVQTAFESIAREASPGQLDLRADEEKVGESARAPVGKGDDLRKVVELREAVWGAVDILSGISG